MANHAIGLQKGVLVGHFGAAIGEFEGEVGRERSDKLQGQREAMADRETRIWRCEGQAEDAQANSVSEPQ